METPWHPGEPAKSARFSTIFGWFKKPGAISGNKLPGPAARGKLVCGSAYRGTLVREIARWGFRAHL